MVFIRQCTSYVGVFVVFLFFSQRNVFPFKNILNLNTAIPGMLTIDVAIFSDFSIATSCKNTH